LVEKFMAKRAKARPPASVSICPASAIKAKLPVNKPPITSTAIYDEISKSTILSLVICREDNSGDLY
jgi:hypothetical protein